MQTHKIIIDTDIGDDIDDAIAIAQALNCPELEILGITTVFRNVELRARMTRRLLGIAGRPEIPVYAGCGLPLSGSGSLADIPCQCTPDLQDVELDTSVHGVDFIIETLKGSAGDVTLVPIGALTNVAMAITKEPAIRRRIREIVWMGGAFYYHFITYNAACDPDAVRVVFESGIPLRVASRDVCMPCTLSQGDIARIKGFGSPVTGHLGRLIDLWYAKARRVPILFDSLAVYAVYGSGLLQFKEERVLVETRGEFTRGLTFVVNTDYGKWKSLLRMPDLASIPPVMVAHQVDSEGMVRHVMERVLR